MRSRAIRYKPVPVGGGGRLLAARGRKLPPADGGCAGSVVAAMLIYRWLIDRRHYRYHGVSFADAHEQVKNDPCYMETLRLNAPVAEIAARCRKLFTASQRWRWLPWRNSRAKSGAHREISETLWRAAHALQCQALNGVNHQRRKVVAEYCRQLAGTRLVKMIGRPALPHYRMPVLYFGDRKRLMRRARRAGYEIRGYNWDYTLADIGALGIAVAGRGGALKGARELARHIVNLPTHEQVAAEDVSVIAELLHE